MKNFSLKNNVLSSHPNELGLRIKTHWEIFSVFLIVKLKSYVIADCATFYNYY